MKIKINKEEIEKNGGVFFTDEKDYIKYIKCLVNDLYKHNENYTKKQYFLIKNIKNNLDNIEIL